MKNPVHYSNTYGMQTAERYPLMRACKSRLTLYITERRYECLLLSFMWLIFSNTFYADQHVLGIVDIYLNFGVALAIFYDKKQLRILFICIICITALLDGCKGELLRFNLGGWHETIYLIFFSAVSREVYKEVLYTKTVTRELLAAALCGFVLLCMMATFIFYLIEINQPYSFTNLGTGRQTLMNLNYFSFTTLLTIGYGDIVPVTLLAKRAVMMMGLLGHFYTVFITSIIIGKYLSKNGNRS